MKEGITLLLASWGALLSSILLVMEILTYKKDKASIWIRAEFGSMVQKEKIKRGLSVRIVNHGRRVAYIHEVRIKFPKRIHIFCKDEPSQKIIEKLRKDLSNEDLSDALPIDSIGGVPIDELTRSDKLWLHQPMLCDPIKLDEGQQIYFSTWVELDDKSCYANAQCEVVLTDGKMYSSPVIDIFKEHDLGNDSAV